MCTVDQIVECVEDIRRKYLTLVYQEQLADEAKATYYTTHVSTDSAHARNNGAHFVYLSNLLKKNSGSSGFMVGGSVTIADVAVWDIVDLHMRIIDTFGEVYPDLMAHRELVAELPGVAAYLASPARLEKINGNGLG